MLVRASRRTQPSTSPDPMQETGRTLRAPLPPISSLSAKQDVLVGLAADLIWRTNVGLEFIQLSGRLCEHLDEPPRRLLDTPSEDGLLKVDGQLLQESDLEDIVARRAFRGITCALPTKAATVHVRISGAPIVGDNGVFLGYQGVGVDVTLEIERWLRERVRLQNFMDGIESISEGLALFDADDRLVLCNQKYQEIHAKLGDVICCGARFEDIVVATANRGIVAEAKGREKMWVRERMRRHRNPGPPIEQLLDTGEWILVRERKTKFGGIVSVRTDITDLKLREIALTESEARADLANRAKSEFLANMSHELRTPLNAVIGFSESLESGIFGALTAQQKTYLRDIGSAGMHLLGLINEILDISKVEAGRIDLREDWIDLHGVIRNCLRLVKSKARENRLSLRSSLKGPPLVIWADEQRLKQIVLNLLSNAMKFTPAGGRVAIKAAAEPGRGAMVRIRDTGIGMRPDDVARCLEPFFQVESALVRKYHGTGLGLPLTKRLVECHDGTLEIESAIGEGTTVIVRIPASRVRSQPGAKPVNVKPL